MDFQATPYVVPLFAAATLTGALAWLAWRHREAPGARFLVLQLLGLSAWTTAYALELLHTELADKVFFAKCRYPGTLLAVLGWFAVSLQYSGRGHWIRPRTVAAALVMPAITLVLVFTNEWHHLIWPSVVPDPYSPALIATHGAAFWVHIVYCYSLVAWSTALVVGVVRTPGRRHEAFPLLISVIAPWVSNVCDLLGLMPTQVDPTPFAFTISALALAWVMLYTRFLDILPSAREAVTQGMRDGMVVLDAANTVVDLNAAAAEIIGRPGRELRGRLATEAFARWPETVARFRDVWDGQAEVSVGEGEDRRDYDLRLSPVLSRRGERMGRVVVFRDISARTRAEREREEAFRAVAEERSRLAALIRSSRDGILLLGRDGRLLVVNEPAVELLRLGGPPQQHLGRSLLEALPPGSRAACALAAVAGRRGPADAPGEGEYDDPPFVVSWTELPVVGDDPSLGRVLVLRDVTNERTLARLRDDLTSTMVHDLRNPLTSIAGALDLLEVDVELKRPPREDVLNIARTGGERMLRLVNAILDVSRLESGRMPLERERVRLAALVAQTFVIATPLARERRLQLDNQVSAAHPPAWADPGLLVRVIENLVSNAVKFTPVGGSVQVAADLEPADPPMLRVGVRDTGPGIPREIEGRLFEKFVTGGQKGSGSGLGLAFCRLAVEAHGGRIWVDSEPGRGSTFSFTVPVKPDEPAA